MARQRVFRGGEEVGLWHPGHAPALPLKKGLPIGQELRTKANLKWDMEFLKAMQPSQGGANAKMILFQGDRNAGKSAASKMYIDQMLMLQAVDKDGNIEPYRGRINDRRPEEDTSEYDKLNTQHKGTKVELATADLNLFDPAMGMTEAHLMEITINVMEQVSNDSGVPFHPYEPFAFQVGIHKMLLKAMEPGFEEVVSPAVLLQYLLTLGLDDRTTYFQHLSQKLGGDYAAAFARNPELRDELSYTGEEPVNMTAEDFRAGASSAWSHLNTLVNGDYGQDFSGRGSLLKPMSARLATFSWLNVSDKAREIDESVIFKWTTIARHKNLLHMLPHLLTGDEEHKAAESAMYARFMLELVKELRSTHVQIQWSTQERDDLRMAGSAGSVVRQKLAAIDASIPVRWIFRQESEQSWPGLYDLGIEEHEVMAIANQQVGSYAIWRANQPLIFAHTHPLQVQEDMIKSNASHDRMMLRRSNLIVPAGGLNMANPQARDYLKAEAKRLHLQK